MKFDFFWAELADGKERESMRDGEGSGAEILGAGEGIPPKEGKSDCESLRYRHKLSHCPVTWQSDKGSRNTFTGQRDLPLSWIHSWLKRKADFKLFKIYNNLCVCRCEMKVLRH